MKRAGDLVAWYPAADIGTRWVPSGDNRKVPAMHRTLVWTGKGGTGKTTTVANVGPELARLGYRVLMVGFDPQGDLEVTFGIENGDRSIVRVEQLLGGGIDPRTAAVTIPVEGAQGTLQLLPCSEDLNGAIAGLARRGFQDLDVILEAFADEIDIALIDTQGALSPISHTAARAADSVVFPLEPGTYEFDALARRLEELEDIKRDEGWAIAPLGVLFVRTDGRSVRMREFRDHLADPEAFGEPLHVFETHTRQQSSVRDHPRLGLPTVLAEPDSNVADDYRRFARELVERIASIAPVAS